MDNFPDISKEEQLTFPWHDDDDGDDNDVDDDIWFVHVVGQHSWLILCIVSSQGLESLS